jgi:hypothetical protein
MRAFDPCHVGQLSAARIFFEIFQVAILAHLKLNVQPVVVIVAIQNAGTLALSVHFLFQRIANFAFAGA